MFEWVKRFLNLDRYDLDTHKKIYKLSQKLDRNKSKPAEANSWKESMIELEAKMPETPAEVEFLREARKYYARFLKEHGFEGEV